jgi:hypothetical protein
MVNSSWICILPRCFPFWLLSAQSLVPYFISHFCLFSVNDWSIVLFNYIFCWYIFSLTCNFFSFNFNFFHSPANCFTCPILFPSTVHLLFHLYPLIFITLLFCYNHFTGSTIITSTMGVRVRIFNKLLIRKIIVAQFFCRIDNLDLMRQPH